jgi:hypothetical protein
LRYQWRRNGSDLPGRTNAVLTIPNAQPADEGDYTVVVSNVRGSITSIVARLRLGEPLSITQIARAGDVTAISFTTVSGFNYTVEYADSLTSPTWVAVSSVAGTGNIMTVNDPSATGPERFYRVRAD